MKIRKGLTSLTIYTGSNGRKGCVCKCEGCSQEKYGSQHPFYQGTLQQIYDVLYAMPDLKRAIILGNPDPLVDVDYCNKISKILVAHNVNVRYSTCGFRALEFVQRISDGVDVGKIDYISFSVDTVDEDKLRRMKKQKISLNEIKEAIYWCKAHNIRTKIQPTLWTTNYEDYKEIIDYFMEAGNDWFSFHAGSFETLPENIDQEHVDPWKWVDLRKRLGEYCYCNNLSLHMPLLFLTDEEFVEYQKERGERCQPGKLRNTQIWLENGYIRTTHCPLLNEVYDFHYNLYDDFDKVFEIEVPEDGYCPIAPRCLGEKLRNRSINGRGHLFEEEGKERLHSVCRQHNYRVNLPSNL